MLIAPSAVLSASEPPMLRVSSRALGDLDVSSTMIMHFPVPLGGFPLYHRYALVPAARDGLWWLQSIDDPNATFILGDPFLHESDYGFDIGDAERAALRIVDESDAFGLVMITLPAADGDGATANCRAPLVMNLREQLAMQIISRDDRHEVRRPIDLARYAPHAHGVRMR